MFFLFVCLFVCLFVLFCFSKTCNAVRGVWNRILNDNKFGSVSAPVSLNSFTTSLNWAFSSYVSTISIHCMLATSTR